MTFADDAGEYSVFVKNQLGEVSASSSLLDEGMNICMDSLRPPADMKSDSEEKQQLVVPVLLSSLCW